jgi:hypothetical protein
MQVDLEGQPVVHLVEGQQLGYLPGSVAEELGCRGERPCRVLSSAASSTLEAFGAGLLAHRRRTWPLVILPLARGRVPAGFGTGDCSGTLVIPQRWELRERLVMV